MKTRHNQAHENNSTPSHELVTQYRAGIHSDDSEASLAAVHYRGSEAEFELGKTYCQSEDAGDRATGADVLAQLGGFDQTFHEESIALLTHLLGDGDPHVVYCAAVGLGHRKATSAISQLASQAGHADELVRFGVVHGLSGQDDPQALDCLVTLASDDDREVRNWAVFSLGSQSDVDTPAIRAALHTALADEDHEIRGEALMGLANRGDDSIIPILLEEWKDDEASILSIEAAEEIKDPRLYTRLEELNTFFAEVEDDYYLEALAKAVTACKASPT